MRRTIKKHMVPCKILTSNTIYGEVFTNGEIYFRMNKEWNKIVNGGPWSFEKEFKYISTSLIKVGSPWQTKFGPRYSTENY